MTFLGHPANRYSDGRLVIDFLTQALGYHFLNPIQLEDAPGINYRHGVNFAYSGSTALSDDTITPYHLQKQVDQVLHFKNRTCFEPPLHAKSVIYRPGTAVNGGRPSADDFETGLYYIQAGGNDLFYGYLHGYSDRVIERVVPDSVSAILSATEVLYNNGARRFFVFNIPAQGCSPATLSIMNGNNDDYGCLKELNNVAQEFNMKLKVAIEQLQQKLKGANIVYGDNYNINYDIIKDPTCYGFSNNTILQASCGIGGFHNYNYNPTLTCSHSGEI